MQNKEQEERVQYYNHTQYHCRTAPELVRIGDKVYFCFCPLLLTSFSFSLLLLRFHLRSKKQSRSKFKQNLGVLVLCEL